MLNVRDKHEAMYNGRSHSANRFYDAASNDANDRHQKSRRYMSCDKCPRVESRGTVNVLYTIGGRCNRDNWNRGSSTVISV